MSRKLAREVTFRILFQLDFNFVEMSSEQYEEFTTDTMFEDNPQLSKRNLEYIKSSVKGTREHLTEIDELIKANLKDGWDLSRLMAVDRNILRLAVYEMKFAEPLIEKGVAINEAVEIAKRYGTDDSARFVNGILVAISK